MKKIIYIHGFNSSPKSEKACLTQAFFMSEVSSFEIVVARFPSSPLAAIQAVEALIASCGRSDVAGFIGSSLGGYYSLYLHRKYSLPAVLLNPAMKPYELLGDYIGENINPYTGERYHVESSHMNELRSLDVASQIDLRQIYLLTETDDEVLDFQQAVTTLNGAKCWIQFGGDHSFKNYPAVLPSIAQFFSNFS